MWGLKPMTLVGLVLLGSGAVIHFVGAVVKDNDTKRFGNGLTIFGCILVLFGF